MKILGIETSCDETAVALVEDGKKVLSDVKATSRDLHLETGGIVPEVAARKQVESMIPVLDKALEGSRENEVDALAVTTGPGLMGSLLIGVETARTLSLSWNLPLVPVNHLLGHIYANFLVYKDIEFPAVSLTVSGGHTDLILMSSHEDYEWLGGTRDDAAGEAFDKVARFLDLASYFGGPVIEEEAKKGDPSAVDFPRPMIDSGDFDFSFSGLKTAVINYVQGSGEINKADISASFQEAVVEVLVEKTLKASKENQVKSILLSGGVAANKRLREVLRKKAGDDFSVFVPPLEYCMDSAVYIAARAYFSYKPLSWEKVKADPALSLRT